MIVPLQVSTDIILSMNRLFFAFSLLAVLTSCTSKYKINGESSISSLDGRMLFLKTLKGSELVKVDSAEVIHGLFKMQGKLDSTEMVMLFWDLRILLLSMDVLRTTDAMRNTGNSTTSAYPGRWQICPPFPSTASRL